MQTPFGYRKLIEHHDALGEVHEMTFSCYHRLPLLVPDERKILLSQAIDRAVERHRFGLTAFVYMPEHVHLLVFARSENSRVQNLLFAIKKPFSFRVKEQLRVNSDPLLNKLTIRERPGKHAFRFWQEGPGYDRNMNSTDTIIASMEYIHANPVRRGLCEFPEHWRWSSAKHYGCPSMPLDPELPTLHGLPWR